MYGWTARAQNHMPRTLTSIMWSQSSVLHWSKDSEVAPGHEAAESGGVVDQDVDPAAIRVRHALDRRLALSEVRDVAGDGRGLSPGRNDLAGHEGGAGFVDVQDADHGPFSAETQGDRAADAVGAAAAGHQRHPARQALSLGLRTHPTPPRRSDPPEPVALPSAEDPSHSQARPQRPEGRTGRDVGRGGSGEPRPTLLSPLPTGGPPRTIGAVWAGLGAGNLDQ